VLSRLHRNPPCPQPLWEALQLALSRDRRSQSRFAGAQPGTSTQPWPSSTSFQTSSSRHAWNVCSSKLTASSRTKKVAAAAAAEAAEAEAAAEEAAAQAAAASLLRYSLD
jgi:hypothetical protein